MRKNTEKGKPSLISKILSAFVLVIIIILVGMIPLNAKPEVIQENEADETVIIKPLLTGFALSPKGSQQEDFLDFFEKVKTTSKVVSWTGESSNLANLNSAPYAVTRFSANYDYTPIIIISNIDKKLLLDFVQKEKPPYLGIGDETNRQDSGYIDGLVKDFDEIYPEIKKLSPDTKIFPTFQLEIMKGLTGANPQWELLNRFPKADVITFTTYPGLVYKSVPDIPENYYSSIKEFKDKPIAFSEVGWSSSADIAGLESDETKQAEFINLFLGKLEAVEPEFAVWTFMYDQSVQKPFDTMGLITSEGKEKEGWKVWTQIK